MASGWRRPAATFEDTLYMRLALSEAESFVGATAPNPPVGACVVRDGVVLGLGAHTRAGNAHAEVVALDRAEREHGKEALRGATLYVTLEPCNHQGKTPPCTEAISGAGIRRVVMAARDPNPAVKGGGIEALERAGIEATLGAAGEEGARLIAPFEKWCRTGRPWISHKLAFRMGSDRRLTMIPEAGGSTFTSLQSLKEAHLERRRSDAILTGIGTVLADLPRFNVRHVPDHPDRRRYLIVVSRDGTEPPRTWLEQEWDLGFEVLVVKDLLETLTQLGELGVHRMLVEAGPALSRAIMEQRLWDERLVFIQKTTSAEASAPPEDLMYRELAPRAEPV